MAVLVVASALALVAGCGDPGETAGEPWNVLLVTFDTTRADRIGCYGNDRIETPTLDGLASDGVRFARAVSAVPITAPSHTSIMTGRYPIAHGVRDNGLFVLGEEQLTLAEILSEEGYATAAAVGAFPVTARFGLDQGFSFYDDHLTGAFEDYLGHRVVPKDELFFDERRAAQVNEAILPWLSENAGGPFFAWVHYFDPHQPFEPAPPYDQLYADDLYSGEIAYADSRLGFLVDHLESLGVLDRTLVIMTADHGEGLGEHNEITHAVLAYDSTLHVPLIIRPPSGEVTPGTVIEQQVGTVDIVPTVLELLGIDLPEGLQGRSLARLWRDSTESAPTKRYAENLSPRLTHGWGELRILYDWPLKYIHGPRPELYDLEADPGERRNLVEERPGDAERLRSTLASFLENNAVAGVSTPDEIDEEVRRRLESLGYLHSSGKAGEQITEQLLEGGIPPQERVVDLNELSAAKHLLFEGRVAEALQYTSKLIERAPKSPLYLELHSTALIELGRLDEAEELVERMRQEGSYPDKLILQLASRRFEDGERRGVASSLRRDLEASPTPSGWWLLATFHQRLGEPTKAREALEQALAEDESFVPARVDLAVHFAQAGDVAAAERELLKALDDSPYYAKAHYNYGTLTLQLGRLVEARDHFRRAVALSPLYLKARLALVAVHLSSGDRAEAEEAARILEGLAPHSPEAAAAADLLRGA